MKLSQLRGVLLLLTVVWLCAIYYSSSKDINKYFLNGENVDVPYDYDYDHDYDHDYDQDEIPGEGEEHGAPIDGEPIGRPRFGDGAIRSNANTPISWPEVTIDSHPRPTQADTVFLVVSTRENFDRRQAIRETWASGHDNVYFVVGEACRIPQDQRSDPQLCDVDPKLDAVDEAYADLMAQDENDLRVEEETYHDMIFTPMPESYRSLPHKLKEAYTFAIQHTTANWIIKADDDFFVRIDTVSEYLRQYNSTKYHVIGRIKEKDMVRRKGKWGEFDYANRFYPPFAIGSAGHAVTRPVAEYVAKNKAKLFEYQGEDTSLAIWLDESGMEVAFKKTPVFDNSGRCNVERFYVVGHKIDPRKMRLCYRKFDEVQVLKAHENYVDITDKRGQRWDQQLRMQERIGDRPFLRRGGSKEERLGLWRQQKVKERGQQQGIRGEKVSERQATTRLAKEDFQRRIESRLRMGTSSSVRALTSTEEPSETRKPNEESKVQHATSSPAHTLVPANSKQPALKEKYQNVTSKVLQSNPWPMPHITEQKMVVIVMTARRNFDKRAAIRASWARGHSNVYFILSDPCPFPMKQMHKELDCEKTPSMKYDPIFPEHKQSMKKEQAALLKEQAEYRDIIYTPGIESYHGLVRKLKEAYDWVVSNTEAEWVLKADDDIFVRVDSVARYLSTLSLANPTVVGRIISHTQVATSGKWADPEYRNLYYPPWPQGSCGYVVSRNIAEYVGKRKESLYEYQGEDSSLGIWLDESNLKHKVDWHNSRGFVNHGNCEEISALVIGHDISLEKMRECYTTSDEVKDLPDHAVDDAAFDVIEKRDTSQAVAIIDSTKGTEGTLSSWFW